MPKHTPKTETPPDTAYLYAIDEAAMLERLSMERVGTWDGELPPRTMVDAVRVTQRDNCAVARAKGSLAGYEVLLGLGELEEFEDGILIGGTYYLPTAAFHARMYPKILDKLAEALSGYRRVVGRAFINGKPQRPITSLGAVGVEIYEGGEWLAPGHIEGEFVVWAVNTPEVAPVFVEDGIGITRQDRVYGPPQGKNDERVDAIAKDVVD